MMRAHTSKSAVRWSRLPMNGHPAVICTRNTHAPAWQRVLYLMDMWMTMDAAVQERLAAEGLDPTLVIQWNGRPKRQCRARPPTYWQEFVQTDEWYVRELVSDVPAEELDAALLHEDWDGDVNSEDEEETDGSHLGDEGQSDGSAEFSDVTSETCESSSADASSSGEGGETSEGERGSESDDGESSAGADAAHSFSE